MWLRQQALKSIFPNIPIICFNTCLFWYRDGESNYYYYGKFGSGMPEINYECQATRDLVKNMAKYWLSFGLDGFRLDAVKHIYMKDDIDSCSSSYAGGYNAWPQLNDLFISPSTLDGSTVVPDNFGDDTTIADKTAYLEAKYEYDQAH